MSHQLKLKLFLYQACVVGRIYCSFILKIQEPWRKIAMMLLTPFGQLFNI
jgi:hypothetical protein